VTTGRLLRAAIAAGTVVLLAGCGAVESVTGARPTQSPTPSANGVADKPAAEIVRLASRAFQDARSVHVKGNGTTDGELYVVDVRIKGGSRGGGKGTVTVSHNTVDLLRIGKDAYIKGDKDFWLAATGNSAAAELLKGKYLKSSSSDPRLKGILFFTDADLFAKTVFTTDGTMTKRDRRTIAGVETIGVEMQSGKDRSILYVATTGQPYPLQLTDTSQTANAGTLDFLDYGRPLTLTPPPADLVIDTSKLGS
jgi:hypothetical protein